MVGAGDIVRFPAAVLLLLLPAVASGEPVPHANDPLNLYWGAIEPAGSGCSDCHSLKAGEAEAATSHIALSARTLGTIRTVAGGAIPANLGCTFCHNRAMHPGRMRGALSGHFDGQRSQHPVGRTFTGATPYADTQNEYLSSVGSNTADEMDCVDCHDPEQVAPGGRYMAHEFADRGGNPFMLRANGVARVPVTVPGRHDEFCRDCHGRDAAPAWKGKDIRLVSHADGRDARASAIDERDGTLLKTTDPDGDGTADPREDQCRDCHGAHATPNAKLFVSAHDNGTDCTSVCHPRGDRNGSFDARGHGAALSTYEYGGLRIDMDLSCTECHVALDTATPNSAGTRKPHAEKREVNGDRNNYKANFNLSKNVNSQDGGTPTGYPKWGICISCHALTDYRAHMSYEGDPTGCQECHDEHGEGAGANIFMIPETSRGAGAFRSPLRVPAGAEQVRYLSPRFKADRRTPTGGPYDFWRSDGNGVCDTTECHGQAFAAGAAGHPGPLDAFLTGGRHAGGDISPAVLPNVDCAACHSHNDPQGGWGARASCEACHASAAPPNETGVARTHADPDESAATHARHAESPLVGGCDVCHAHDGKTVPPGYGAHMDGAVDFGGARLDRALDYDGPAYSTPGCTGANGCHDADEGDWRAGLGPDGCADCHDAGEPGVIDADKALDQGGYPAPGLSSSENHARHIDGSTAVPGDCDGCHGAGATLGGHAGHRNGKAETVPRLGYDRTTGGCAATCHEADAAHRWASP